MTSQSAATTCITRCRPMSPPSSRLAALVLLVGACWSDWNTHDAGVVLLALAVFPLDHA